jgi:DNA polymerase
MQGRRKILDRHNGNLDSPIVFIAEAPGRLGAEKSGIPLFGDQTGRNFESLIATCGLSRDSIFITNAVLCNPQSPNGKNDSPTLSEIRNCSRHLKETLDIIRPRYIAPLGGAALTALNIVHPHEIKLSAGVGKVFDWQGCKVYPLYHPGPRASIARTKEQQAEDYCRLAHLMAVL